MKSEFNKSWNSSKQPRKQVKFRANAPNHIKKKFMGSCLDKSLRVKLGRRTAKVRKGDEVKVMRGKFKGRQGKVGFIDIKNCRIQIDGVQRMKSKNLGGEKMVSWFHPSKVKIIILDENDGKRFGNRKNIKKETEKIDDKKDKKDTSKNEKEKKE